MTTPRPLPTLARTRLAFARALATSAALVLCGGGPAVASEAASAAARPVKGSPAGQPERSLAGSKDEQAGAATRLAQPARMNAPAPAAAASPDPVQLLRERLADRLAGVRTNPAGSAVDLRVVSVPPVESAGAAAVLPRNTHATPATPAERRSARLAAAAATSTLAAAGGSHGSTRGSVHWSYSGVVGPQAWGGLRPEFKLCAKGDRQSPIDIREGMAVDLEPIQFRYQPSAFSAIDNGHTAQVNVAPGNSIDVGGRRFELLQFHFHRPSEERIDGRQFELSVHLVHKDSEGRQAVVGVLLGKGAAQPVVQTVWNNLPLEKHQDIKARAMLDPNELLPQDRRYYTYMGSLTTPPCSEGVQWLVMRQPVSATPEQIEIFSRMYPMNARPLQNAAGRRILQSN